MGMAQSPVVVGEDGEPPGLRGARALAFGEWDGVRPGSDSRPGARPPGGAGASRDRGRGDRALWSAWRESRDSRRPLRGAAAFRGVSSHPVPASTSRPRQASAGRRSPLRDRARGELSSVATPGASCCCSPCVARSPRSDAGDAGAQSCVRLNERALAHAVDAHDQAGLRRSRLGGHVRRTAHEAVATALARDARVRGAREPGERPQASAPLPHDNISDHAAASAPSVGPDGVNSYAGSSASLRDREAEVLVKPSARRGAAHSRSRSP